MIESRRQRRALCRLTWPGVYESAHHDDLVPPLLVQAAGVQLRPRITRKVVPTLARAPWCAWPGRGVLRFCGEWGGRRSTARPSAQGGDSW